MTTILGIETSCDDTAAAVVRDGRVIHANVVSSQLDLHAQFGGVFPEVASRAHAESISAVVNRAMDEASLVYEQLDAIAVTQGPGLIGSLLVGINFAKGLALATGKPLLGINHLEGHVYSLLLEPQSPDIDFPVVVLIVSGGHSELVLMTGHGIYRRLGGTIDDAAGEAFDKVGRTLGLPFPGGPAIERAARDGDATAYRFPIAQTDSPYDFSFSGLKTAVLREVTVPPSGLGQRKRRRGAEKRAQLRDDIDIANVAAAFQDAATDALTRVTIRAARQFHCSEIWLSGGVSANQMLRHKMRERSRLPARYPPLALCTDNGAMIAAAAHYRFLAGHRSGLDFEARSSWRLSGDVYAD
ncbi:MAG: tRNA (adenosine(37)-N6)-threonylcarbamoyltransferase complex transferase subunit TsaD [Chloroflexota bacterium]|nr:tRNA (adenosine(37)-N6)-threonylcarbamoyltransferase complex transferase subunit TsaD [Chloroflexota bacterium]